MLTFGVIVIAAIVVFVLWRSFSTKGDQAALNASVSANRQSYQQEPIERDVREEIPLGYRIYEQHPEIAGIQFRKENALSFANANNQSLKLQRDASNEHDPNAIRIIGVAEGKEYFIGFVPKEIALQIAKTNFLELIKPRLVRIYVSAKGFIDIQYQILGPKAEKARYDAFIDDSPAEAWQKDELQFFGADFGKKLTFGEANKLLKETREAASDEQRQEWSALETIYSDFDDAEFRADNEIKKVSKKVLDAAIEQLRKEGRSYRDLELNSDLVIAKILEKNPELARK